MADAEPTAANPTRQRGRFDSRSRRSLPAVLRRSLALLGRAARREFLLLVGVQALSGCLLAVGLLLARSVFSDLIRADRANHHLGAALPGLIGLVATTGLTVFLQGLQTELVVLLRELVSRGAEREVLSVAAAVPLEAFETPAFFDRVERARRDAAGRSLMLTTGLTTTLSAGFAAAGVSIALLAIEPLIVPVAALAALPAWLALTRNSRAYYQFTVDMTPDDRLRNYLAGVLVSEQLAKEVRAFELEQVLLERHARMFDARIAAVRKLVRARALRALLGSVAATVVTAVGFGLLVWLLSGARLPELATAASGLLVLGQQMRSGTQGVGTLYEATLYLEDVATFLDMAPTGAPAASPAAARPLVHDPPVPADPLQVLEVDEISFAYPGADEPALHSVSMTVARGEVVALVGVNGSGKTTLTKLIGQLYLPASGTILWNGSAVTAAEQPAIRAQIATTFQDFARYYFSAAENIAVGRASREPDPASIEAAAVRADADSFLSRLPRGYETPLSRVFEGGTNLSLGQWQRVALARTYFRDASLVIMDEPTASLDAVAESDFYDAVSELCADRALVLVSHRFASARRADRIYVVDGGRIVEVGGHDELVARNGLYARLYQLQAAAFESP